MKNTLRSFRLVCAPNQIPDVEALLRAEGFEALQEAFFGPARVLAAEPFPLGRSLAARFGYIYIQDKSSMLPPLALAPEPGAAVLDMCASPGSKTGLLSQLVGPHGIVLANEPAPERLATLRANMRHLGCFNVATCRYEGQRLPLRENVWPYILLDAPCSGWGTLEKNPAAARMWSGKKTVPLEVLQRELLCRAAALLAPGGRLVYSTCTTNERENEAQVRFAVEHLGLSVTELAPFAGFSFSPSLPGCLLVDGAGSSAQGFFLACLTKAEAPPAEMATSMPPLPGTVISPAEFRRRAGLDSAWLPPHEFLCAGGRAYLILEKARRFFPETLRWQGFGVGKAAGDFVAVDPALRLFVPPEPDDDALVLDTVDSIHALLSGQSMRWSGTAGRRTMYYKSLPLGFLTVKGGRCLWSDR